MRLEMTTMSRPSVLITHGKADVLAWLNGLASA